MTFRSHACLVTAALALLCGQLAGGAAQAQPRLTVDPLTFGETLANGASGVRQLTIGNAGSTDLHWSATMVLGGPPSSPVTPSPHILLMTSTSSQTDPHAMALARRNLAYTPVTDWISFGVYLKYLGPWDLVIVSTRAGDPLPETLEALSAHLDRGGALLCADSEPVADNPLLMRLGITPVTSLAAAEELVPAAEPHRCFTWPNRIDRFAPHPGPDGDAGVQIVSARGHARPLASFAGHPGSGAVVVNARRRAVYNAFHPDSFLGDADTDGVPDAVELAENEIAYLTETSSWVAVDPMSGVVPAGGSQVVDVAIEMSTSCAGTLAARIGVVSDDPSTPYQEVAVSLATVPERRLTPTAERLDFGTQYVGAVVPLKFRVLNDGCASLQITGATVDHPAFRLATSSPFTIPPLSARDIVIEYAPTSTESTAGTITLTSNDPSVPLFAVSVAGAGRLSPAVAVRADSLALALAPGESATRHVSISNFGLADLEWTLTPGTAVKTRDSAEIDLTGVNVLWTRAHNELDANSRCSTLIADLRARGATVSVNANPLTEHLLGAYDVLCVRNGWREWSAAETAVLRRWIRDGGSLLLDGYDPYVMSAIPEGIGAGFTFVPVGQSRGLTTAIHPHATTTEISSLSLDWVPCTLVPGPPPATTLADGPDGLPAIVADEIRAGRVIAIAALYTFDNSHLLEADNRLFALQAFDWLAGPRWLRATPTGGVLAPDETQEVTIDLDAALRCGVTLQQPLTITTNDPLHPNFVLPVELTVPGNRVLVALADSLDFGWLYSSQSRADTLLVRNDGCELLTVTSLVTGHEAFAVTTPVPFSIPPDGAATVTVAFAPVAPGPVTADLVIDSDDSRGALAPVRLSGRGVAPPVASTAPSELAVALDPGEAATRTVTLANTGQSELDWKVVFHPDVMTRPTVLPTPTASAAAGELPAGVLSLTAELRDLAGQSVHWDVSHGQYLPGNWSTMVDDLLLRGATIEVNSLPLTPDRLEPMDVLWITDTADTWQEAEIGAVADWIHNGGGLLLEGNGDIAVGVFNRILAATGVAFRYDVANAQAGLATGIHDHPTTTDIALIHLSDPGARLTGCETPARPLVDDPQGVTVAAAAEAGIGRVVALSGQMFNVWSIFYGDNRRFGNQVFDWLAGPRWVRVAPYRGVMPAGGSEDLEMAFNAARCRPGLYTGRLEFVSNDPVTPMLNVPISLNVGGAPELPRIVISASTGKVGAEPLVAGTAAGATDGFDPGLDLPAPEPRPAELAAWFAHPEWEAAQGDRFLADLRAPFDPAGPGREWSFLVANGHAATVTLEFAFNTSGLTASGLLLVDTVTGAAINLHTTHSYVYSADPGLREFRLRLGRGPAEPVPGDSFAQASPPPSGPDLRVRPNPFNPSAELSFHLVRDGQVAVLVYDLRGVLVCILDAGHLAAGPAVVVWNGLDQRGLAAASGTYLVRLTQDGRQLGPSRKMVLLR